MSVFVGGVGCAKEVRGGGYFYLFRVEGRLFLPFTYLLTYLPYVPTYRGDFSFRGTDLMEIQWDALDAPARVESVGQGAFSGCSRLASLVLVGALLEHLPWESDDNGTQYKS